MKLLAKLGLVAAIGGVGATLYAQPSSSTPSGAVSEALARAQIIHEQILVDSQQVQQAQQLARKEKDVIKLNCVNDKLVQMKPLMNEADKTQTEIQASVDPTAPMAVMVKTGESIHHLREEADRCIGEPQLGADSSNSFTAPPGAQDPTGVNPFGPPGGQLEPPAYASPTM